MFYKENKIIKTLKNAYKPVVPVEECPLLYQLKESWSVSKPLSGKKILINQHITSITLLIIDILVSAGAQVEVMASPELVIHGSEKGKYDALTPILESGLTYYKDGHIPEEKAQDYYDCIIDCGGYHVKNQIKPKLDGFALELTHTPPEWYNNIEYPVIDIDNSKTKEIETHYGTGDGCIRAIMTLYDNMVAIYNEIEHDKAFSNPAYEKYRMANEISSIFIDPKTIFSKNNYVIWGFGKVGKGIAAALVSAGVLPENITIIDSNPSACLEAMKWGYSTIHSDSSQESRNKIINKLENCFCMITATGQEGVITQMNLKAYVQNIKLLLNMGTPDEYGSDYGEFEVFFGKKLANFINDSPTAKKYLDPIFHLLLNCTNPMNHQNLKKGIQATPADLDNSTLAKFYSTHNTENNQNDLWSYQNDYFNHSSTKANENLYHLSRINGIKNGFNHYNSSRYFSSSEQSFFKLEKKQTTVHSQDFKQYNYAPRFGFFNKILKSPTNKIINGVKSITKTFKI